MPSEIEKVKEKEREKGAAGVGWRQHGSHGVHY
jgi:hypothetical protein